MFASIEGFVRGGSLDQSHFVRLNVLKAEK